MQIINQNLLDCVTEAAKQSPRLRMNHNFHVTLEAPAQRMLNALEPGTVLPIHRHQHTAETYVLLRGRINMIFYNDRKVEIERFELDPLKGEYGVHIPKGIWHSIEVLEEGSVIFEVKEGPYMALGKVDIIE